MFNSLTVFKACVLNPILPPSDDRPTYFFADRTSVKSFENVLNVPGHVKKYQQAPNINPMIVWGGPNVADAGPPLNQHCVNDLCLVEKYHLSFPVDGRGCYFPSKLHRWQ